jgi:proteasome lid subunit RPN8/RPN11
MGGDEMVISLGSTLYQEIVQYFRSKLPEEACGFITGFPVQGGFQAVSFHPVANIASHPLQHFEMNPFEVVPILYKNRETSRLIGIIHSHPSMEAFPSEEDRLTEWHRLPSYWILSFQAPDEPDLQIFEIKKAPLTEVRKLSFVIDQ